jgi:hypothetical protein
MNGFGEFGCENGVFKGEWKDNTIQISKFNLSHNNLE